MRLTKAGWNVAALYPRDGHPLSKTSGISPRLPYDAVKPLESIRSAIETVKPELVVPCDDRAVGHLHELQALAAAGGPSLAHVAALIERSIGSPASYPVVESRIQLMSCARDLGILTPETRLIGALDELRAGHESMPFPWVLKADGSWGGHGVRIAGNLRDAERAWQRLAAPLSMARYVKRLLVDRDPYWLQAWQRRTAPSVVVQANVAGRPANCAVVAFQGEVLAGLAVEVVGAKGITGSATIVRVVEGSEMLDAARRLARRLNMSGFFGLDFMIESGTGKTFLIEMNPRATPLSHLSMGQGRDLMAALLTELSGARVAANPAVDGDLIAYFPQAWHWDPSSELLNSSFQDIPWDEPALVDELRRVPWPDRGLLAKLSNPIRGLRFEERASKRGGVFEEALALRPANERHSHSKV